MKPLIHPTPEEDRRINEGIAADPDAREWTEEDFARATRGRPPELFRKEQVTIRLDQDVIAHFKGDAAKGWQTRVNAALRKAAGLD